MSGPQQEQMGLVRELGAATGYLRVQRKALRRQQVVMLVMENGHSDPQRKIVIHQQTLLF